MQHDKVNIYMWLGFFTGKKERKEAHVNINKKSIKHIEKSLWEKQCGNNAHKQICWDLQGFLCPEVVINRELKIVL